ncbi:ABC transporter ATP-binding protein [Kocuria sp. CPCC 205268]|uniref:ABC transporter ATP-binding protein n=1 Tax=Kocuria oxytropis TaxID=3058913 RepID=UPI0034D5FCE9
MRNHAPLIDVHDLSCGFSGSAVCGPVTLSVRLGEIVAIVGLNGAGKSTVLRTITGRQHPLGGQVHFAGEPRQEGSATWRRAVAAVFDDDAWFPGLTVQEHLQLVATGHGIPDPLQSVRRELAFFGLTDRAHALPDALSSGQRRRLLLAAAFIRPTEVLFLDEPEQRLDPAMVAALADRLIQHARTGACTVVITHNPQFLTAVSDRCLVIDTTVREVTPGEGAALITGELL